MLPIIEKIHINERLRELRIKSGYTQVQIAKILNIDRSTYSYYEIGKTTPDVTVLITLAKVFNIPIENLLSDEVKKIPVIFTNSPAMKESLWELSGHALRRVKRKLWIILKTY